MKLCFKMHREPLSKDWETFGSRHIRKSLSNQQTTMIIKWKPSRNTKQNRENKNMRSEKMIKSWNGRDDKKVELIVHLYILH